MFLFLPLLFACSDNSQDELAEEETYTLYVTYKGTEYVVPCKIGPNGNPVYLDEDYKALYNNVISKNENLVTYMKDDYSITYYDSVDEMMKDLNLRFVDLDSAANASMVNGVRTRVASDVLAGRVTLWKDMNYGGSTRNFQSYYTKFYSHHRLSDFKFNDEASSIKVWSNIPPNDSVYVNWADVETTFNEVPHVETPTQGSVKYATNDLRVVFMGYQHKDYGGKVLCCIPSNQGMYSHYRLSLIDWNDIMSSVVIRLAVDGLYTPQY
mgnify:CR=1 FL=1